MTIQSLTEGVVSGDQRSIARAISLVELGAADGHALVGSLFARTGSTRIVGVTGAPGVGKSTLVDELTGEWRENGQRVGILAVDPTSPFSGGAILGDRIRMQSHAGDNDVYVRSMATRGHLGGLARATSDAAVVLDAAGCDIVLIETVGVGQGEVEIARTADVSVVVSMPGTGDDVQALKAGIMEIADIFVVNKADRDGADRAVSEIQAALALREESEDAWQPPVLRTEATRGVGVSELLAAIETVGDRVKTQEGRFRDRARVRLHQALMERVVQQLDGDDGIRSEADELIERIADGEVDPYTAAARLIKRL